MYDFPNSPTIGQITTTPAGSSFTWDGTKWVAAGGTLSIPVSIANGGTGATTAAAAPWVETAGDQMTGNLGITPASGAAAVFLNKPASGVASAVYGQKGGLYRWSVELGSSGTETGTGNTGSDFVVARHNDAGTFIDYPISIVRSTGAVSLRGTTGATNAAAGEVGEFISSTVLSGSAVGLSNGTPANITTISLTAGDWDVAGSISFSISAPTSATVLQAWVNTTSASSPDQALRWQYNSPAGGAGGVMTAPAPPLRLSLAATTTVYLSTNQLFSSGTLTACGIISARRVR